MLESDVDESRHGPTSDADPFSRIEPLALLEQAAQDFRYAWRGLRHSLAFAATTVLTLAVGLGLVTVA